MLSGCALLMIRSSISLGHFKSIAVYNRRQQNGLQYKHWYLSACLAIIATATLLQGRVLLPYNIIIEENTKEMHAVVCENAKNNVWRGNLGLV